MNSKIEHPVLPWHREAAKELYAMSRGWSAIYENFETVIARHDPNAATLRLLEDAADEIEGGESEAFGLTAYQVNLCKQIRAHLAAQKGSQ